MWNDNYDGGYRRDDRRYPPRGYNDDRGGYRRDDRSYPPRDFRGRNEGYNGGGYNRGYQQQEPRDFKYAKGEVVSLVQAPDIAVTIIRIGREQYECRMPDLSVNWFYEDELMPLQK